MSNLGPLPHGGRAILVGGGPAGAACALAILRSSAETGRELRVTIIEGKEFSEQPHYNQCLGVLSPPLPALLEQDLGVPFPYHLSRGEVQEYVLHAEREALRLYSEDSPSIVLRRVQFDDYMLKEARQRGVEILAARAVDVEFSAEGVTVYTDRAPVRGDVVVGAFGLDEGTASLFERQTAYRRPKALDTLVTKFHPGEEAMASFGSTIHAFLPSHAQIEFSAVTPKGNHLSIVIAGRSVHSSLMRFFLELPSVREVLPSLNLAGRYDPNDLRFFKGRFPSSLARGFYGDRFVMIGDASGLVRAFKGKGITSAIQTGIRAASTILHEGISRQAFHAHYRPANLEVIRDMPYGRLMRLVAGKLASSRRLDLALRAAKFEPRLQAAFFGAVSGYSPYRQVWADALSPRSLWAIVRSLLPGRGRIGIVGKPP